jgi:hypothetical protein
MERKLKHGSGIWTKVVVHVSVPSVIPGNHGHVETSVEFSLRQEKEFAAESVKRFPLSVHLHHADTQHKWPRVIILCGLDANSFTAELSTERKII